MHLLIIDPQNDFCDPKGALFVPGANSDMDRLADFIDGHQGEIEAITLTLDTHQLMDISHRLWFKNQAGEHPEPFTVVTYQDVASGTYSTSDPKEEEGTLAYLKALEARGRYPHVIWPDHCLAGTPGHGVWPALQGALHRWEAATLGRVFYIWKGLNPRTEHFSALEAEVPRGDDPGTQANEALLDALLQGGSVYVAGEALSHCVANTVRDILNHPRGAALAKSLILIEDAMSPVTGFEAQGESFLKDMAKLGVGTIRVGL